LYFQITGMSYGWLMNTTKPVSSTTREAPAQGGSGPMFISPPLYSTFTYEKISVTFYHDFYSFDRSFFVAVGWLDAINSTHEFTRVSGWVRGNTSVTTISIPGTLSLTPQQRLWIVIGKAAKTGTIHIYWGDSIRDSHISYSGTAKYIPELSSLFIIPVFIVATLMVILVYYRGKLT